MTEHKKTRKLNYDLKMESAIIGYMVYGLSEAKWICTIMEPEWFYVKKNINIFETIKTKINDNITPDITLLCKWLTDKGILGDCGGAEYIEHCLGEITTMAHLSQYAKELRQLYFDRQILVYISVAAEDPSIKNVELLRQACFDRESFRASDIIDLRKSVDKIIEITSPREGGLYEVFGLEEMDEILNGLLPGNVLTIGGRPGAGKTVIATQVIINFARKYKETILYFPTEMSYEETLMRMLTPMSRVPGWKFRKRVFDQEGNDIRAIRKIAEELSELKIFVKFKPSPTMEDIRAGVLSTKCKLVVVDYIQRMKLPKGPRNEAIDEVMLMLSNLAEELGILVIILSQLDRKTDKLTGAERPQMADLKGSGSIEQESHAIFLLWRNNKKDPHRKGKKLVDEDIEGIRAIEAICVKNRGGQSDVSVQLIFEEKYISFREWTKADRPPEGKKNDKKSELPQWNDNL